MSVLDGQPVSAAVTNPAFLKPDVDDFTTNRLGSHNSLPNTGFFVQDIQRYLNTLGTAAGLNVSGNFTAEADTTGNTYGSTSTAILNGDSFKTALKKLSDKFAATTGSGGHGHTGVSGDAPKLALQSALTGIRSGQQSITNGTNTVTVTFGTAFSNAVYGVAFAVRNLADSQPVFLQGVITNQTTTAFTVTFNANADTANYTLTYIATEAV